MKGISNLKINHDKIYIYILAFTVLSIPLSRFAISLSMLFLTLNWILELNFKTKWERIKKNKGIIFFSLVFFVHIIWLINTENFHYAIKDISNKVILLLYPIILGTSRKITNKELKQILLWLTLSVIVASLISTSVLIGITKIQINDIREISLFMSHIRFSLLIDFCIFSLFYLIYSKKYILSRSEIIIYIIGIMWLVVFLYLLKSYTGIIIFFIVSLVVLIRISMQTKALIPRFFLQVSVITILLLIASFITHSISKFYSVERIDMESLDLVTKNGNKYKHFINNKQIENGNFVWIYYCDKELKSEWEKRSSLDYNGIDSSGQMLKTTLIRYLTSKGLKKDSVGMSKLTSHDIENIENGMANYIFENKYSIYPKVYQLIWQIDVYLKGTNPSGNSITQRVEYLKTSFHIIKDNFWFGVGTGDVKDKMMEQYDIDNSQLSERWRLRSHNQFVAFFLTFGIFGFIIILFALFYPPINQKAFGNLLFTILFLIVLLSFINEDTLETQIGITFFSYFYSLFLFGSNFIINNKEENV